MRQTVSGLRWATLVLVGSAVVAACQPGEDQATIDTGLMDTGAVSGTGGAGGTMALDARSLGTIAAVHASEVAMGRLAQERASNEQVKDFAETIEQDHQRMLEQAQQADTAQADPQLKQQAMQTMQRLQGIRGAAFDTAFVNAQVNAHQQALQQIQQMTGQSGTDTAGRAGAGSSNDWVMQSRQMIQSHLQQAQQLQQELRGGTNR